MSGARALRLLVFAMGGEGGLTLSRWLADVAEAEGYLVQHTSLPGVAQRTGATTYYFEFLPRSVVDGTEPVFGLDPAPGDVDVVLASELVEAVRAVDLGYVTPGKTTLITSSHREYLYSEKSVPGDGALEEDELVSRLEGAAAKLLIEDFKKAVTTTKSHMSTILLGVLSASEALPFAETTYREVLARRDNGGSSLISGFEAGLQALDPAADEIAPAQNATSASVEAFSEALSELPLTVREVAELGVEKLLDYQNPKYARLYLARLQPLVAGDSESANPYAAAKEAARQLALWMAFEDVIRIAQLKTRRSRLNQLMARKEDQRSVVQVVDFLRPGLEEFASLLPPPLGRPLTQSKRLTRLFERVVPPLRVRTTGILGFTLLALLRALRPLRPLTYRYKCEQALIDRWLTSVNDALKISTDAALEIAKCPALLKGYGETRQRGEKQFLRILEITEAGLKPDHSGLLAKLRQTAEREPAGEAFDDVLMQSGLSPAND